jgi:hypothetical protein
MAKFTIFLPVGQISWPWANRGHALSSLLLLSGTGNLEKIGKR